MPYARPSWATAVQQKYSKLVNTLGNASAAVRASQSQGVGLNEIPAPNAIRRNLPDLTIPGVSMPQTGSATKADFSRGMTINSNTRNFGVTGGGAGAAGTIAQVGQVTLRTLGKILEKTQPSEVVGAIKGTVVETAKSAGRFFGSVGLSGQIIGDALYNKIMSGGKLSPQELENLKNRQNAEYLKQLSLMGYDLSGQDVNSKFRKQVALDAFNVATTVATLAPIGEVGAATVKGAPAAGRNLLSVLTKGLEKSALGETAPAVEKTVLTAAKQAVKEIVEGKGAPLIVDAVGNVFAKDTTASVVKYFLKSGVKNVLQTTSSLIKPALTALYTAGMEMELTNEARKYIDPESAARVARDQRTFVDSLSTPERLFLDLGVGLYLPFSVPGLKTTYNALKIEKGSLDAAMLSKAFDKAFSDAKSLEVLDKISEFKNILPKGGFGLDLDMQLKGNLLKHLSTVMGEDKVAITTEHALEVMGSWAKVPTEEALALIKRGDATALSWYSQVLGRPLDPAERLMHWFITETEGRFVGDIGNDLVARFEQALKLRTTGIDATVMTVERIVQRQEDIKLLAGDIIKVGDAASARQAVDAMLLNKTDLLTQLKSELQKIGGDFIVKEGNIVVPDQFTKVPAIRQFLDTLTDVQKSIDGTIAEARGMGIPDKILQLPKNKWLLDKAVAFEKYTDITTQAQNAVGIRDLFGNFDLASIKSIKKFVTNNAGATDRLFTGDSATAKAFRNAVSDLRASIMPDATQDEILNFILSVPTKADMEAKIPRAVSTVITKAEKELLQINEAVSNFDKYLLAVERTNPGALPKQVVKDVVTEMRKVEAQLPRGAFAPEYLAKETRWGAGVTPIPISREAINPPEWAQGVANLMDANGITRKIVDYLTPHNPNDIYIKAMNKLEALIEAQAPGKAEAIMKQVSKVQDKGISMIPLMPGGGPHWEALGKPMISGVEWKALDDIGNSMGVKNLGRISREAFVNTFTESGFKPGIVDRLRAAPGIGAIYDAIYRQYMMTRFALNPMFHAQQLPETAIIGALRSFNLPAGMSEAYLKSAFRSPLKALNAEETLLYKAIRSRGLGEGARGASMVEVDVLKSSTIEERKRLGAFMAEFPVQVRGQLFDMPAMGGVDPLAVAEYKSWILGLQNSPKAMADAITEAFTTKGFDLKMEAIRRAVKTTNVEVQKFVTYNLNRSAFEKDLHSVLFPFSYQKKFWTEVGKATFGGSVARPVVAGEVLNRLSDLNDSPSMLELRAKYPTMVGWIWSVAPLNPTFPLVNLSQGSLWFGGVRADPSQAVLFDTFVDPDGKYNFMESPDQAAKKLGGGGLNFWTKDIPALYSEIFKNETPAQTNKYIYLLKQMQLESQINRDRNK